jgi:serine/threonine protein kinase
METYPCPYNEHNELIKTILEKIYENNKEDFEMNKIIDYYSKLLNPQHLRKCLEEWYDGNQNDIKPSKDFFNDFFISLHELHKNDVFHHDLHDENVWYCEEKNIFRFIDFGLSAGMYETLYGNPKEEERHYSQFGTSSEEPDFMEYFKSVPDKKFNIDSICEKKYLDEHLKSTYHKIKGYNTEPFNRDELRILMMVELSKPLNNFTPIEYLISFQLFNISIMHDIISTLVHDRYILKNSSTKWNDIQDKIHEIYKIYINFLADKYADAITNYYTLDIH